jgi:hypothetical protein
MAWVVGIGISYRKKSYRKKITKIKIGGIGVIVNLIATQKKN